MSFFVNAHSQNSNEFFHELVLEKKLYNTERLELVGEANFKNFYNEPGWRRWGLSFVGSRKLNKWSFSAGLNGYYTFDKSIINFYEVRPWAAIQFNLPIVENVKLRQRLKYEWRFFYSENNQQTRENFARLRYQLGFDIPLSTKEEPIWKIRPLVEWFFIKDPESAERFSNERDIALMAIKRLKKGCEFTVGLTREIYNDAGSERQYGYIIFISYSL